MDVDIECQYCGKKWVDQEWRLQHVKCEKCGSGTKYLKFRKKTEGSTDVYGYRFGPDFPKKPSHDW